MSGGYHISDQETPHFLTFQVVNWVDVFTRQTYRDIVVAASTSVCARKC